MPRLATPFRIVQATEIQTDTYINPIYRHFALIFMNLENPFAFSANNITAANLEVLGQPTTFDSYYEYNELDYPTHE